MHLYTHTTCFLPQLLSLSLLLSNSIYLSLSPSHSLFLAIARTQSHFITLIVLNLDHVLALALSPFRFHSLSLSRSLALCLSRSHILSFSCSFPPCLSCSISIHRARLRAHTLARPRAFLSLIHSQCCPRADSHLALQPPGCHLGERKSVCVSHTPFLARSLSLSLLRAISHCIRVT